MCDGRAFLPESDQPDFVIKNKKFRAYAILPPDSHSANAAPKDPGPDATMQGQQADNKRKSTVKLIRYLKSQI